MSFTDRLTFLIEYLDLPAATDDPSATWQAFQTTHLNNSSLFSIADKSRQVGFSWLIAAEAVASACINPRDTSIFVSINQDEAKEKIRYARYIIEALDRDVRPKLRYDSTLQLEFANGSRLISHPQRPVLGKAKSNIYLDEFAHYRYAREIYRSSLPATTRGGRLRIGSSPRGATGLFWEIFSQKMRPYPGFRRQSVPWWSISSLCADVPEAIKLAPYMPTADRVWIFGTKRLVEIFENMILEDFQQEYECAFVDESVSWITWEEIQRNQDPELLYYHSSDTHKIDAALMAIEELAAQLGTNKVERAFAGGMDIGRRKDRSEIFIVGKTATMQTPLRLSISLDRVEFAQQEAVIDRIMTVLPMVKFKIDGSGLGMELAEKAEKKYPVIVEGVTFTAPVKEVLAVGLKIALQKSQLPLPAERELSYQIHSIRRKMNATSISFDTEDGETQHHADKFWGLALARQAAVGANEETSFAIKYA